MLAATWSDRGKVHIWDLTRPLLAVNDSSVMAEYTRNEESPSPVFTFSGHQVEGFALDWAKTTPGRKALYCKKSETKWALKTIAITILIFEHCYFTIDVFKIFRQNGKQCKP